MNDGIQQLVKSVLNKNSLAECTVSELQQLTERYPYFSAGQLLLAQKLKEESSEKYQSQLEKASLFFSNPLWMDYITNQAIYESGENDISNDTVPETSTPPVKDIGESLPEIENVVPAETFVKEPESVPEPEANPGNTIKEPVEVIEINEEPFISTESSEEELPELLEEETEPILPLPQFKIEAVPSAKDDLLFEPYHTVDYFASVGIKPDTIEKPSDRFGKQLKSFTEWLKSMKKLPETEIESSVDTKQEEKVVNLAEHSIEDRVVVTETMAEVWEKQGNAAKAIEVYHKLSLLNPAKSTYFAAKIEQLKKV